MTRWYPLESADADFFQSAPHVFTYQKRFAASPAQVWEQLTSDASIAAWGPATKEVNWTSPRPFGVGTTREVVALGGATMRERFFRWEEGSGHSFAAYESTFRCSSASPRTTSSKPTATTPCSHGSSRSNRRMRLRCRSR